MKLLLYCTKSRKQLFFDKIKHIFMFGLNGKKDKFNSLNGKIVAECDFEVEEIEPYKHWTCEDDYNIHYDTNKLHYDELLEKSCLNNQELDDYLDGWYGYAIHIKNLHIFDEPRELSDYYTRPKKMNTFDGYSYTSISLDKAPQNMMYCCDEKEKDYILISIQPQWLCKILNGEKTIEIRKKILKEMLK